MCLSIPSKVVEFDKYNMAIVVTMGVWREVTLDLIIEKVEIGDYVLIHVGFALNKISQEEAQLSLDAYTDIAALMNSGESVEEEGNMDYVRN